jgi:ParB/RepB/Spo0J family partition protein
MTAALSMQMLSIPLADIDPSPTNPRKTFANLDELAADFKVHGVLQPLIVRAHGKRFECVDGERRLRAARLAKLEQIPAQVRELTDLEVLEIQIVSNAKRADVHPVEEAEAYRQLRDVHKLSVQEISAKVGRPVGTVYERLKLCELAPEVKKAALEGKLPASHAVLIARIPDKKLQAEALKSLIQDGEPANYREAVNIIHRHYMLQLKDAPFDITDAKLLPAAGPCTTCPKRTGNQRELFSDVKSPDVCSDPTCHAAKVTAAAEVKLKVIEEKGKTVLRGDKVAKLFQENYAGEHNLKHDSGFVPLQGGQHYVDGRGYVDVAAVVKKNPNIKTVTVAHPDTGKPVELVPVKELPKSKERAYGTRGSYEAAQKTREENERKRQALAVAVVTPLVKRAEKGFDKELLAAMVTALAHERQYDGLDGILERRAGKELSYKLEEKLAEDLQQRAAKKSEAELRGWLFEMVAVNSRSAEGLWKGEPEGNLTEAAKALGVDLKKAKQEHAESLKPKPPAPAKPGEPVCAVPGCGVAGKKAKDSPGLWCESHGKSLAPAERKSIFERGKRLATPGQRVVRLPAKGAKKGGKK